MRSGPDRLARDLGAVGEVLDHEKPSAAERLRALLGDALTDTLLAVCTGCAPVGAGAQRLASNSKGAAGRQPR
jgi:hypothetical protein